MCASDNRVETSTYLAAVADLYSYLCQVSGVFSDSAFFYTYWPF